MQQLFPKLSLSVCLIIFSAGFVLHGESFRGIKDSHHIAAGRVHYRAVQTGPDGHAQTCEIHIFSRRHIEADKKILAGNDLAFAGREDYVSEFFTSGFIATIRRFAASDLLFSEIELTVNRLLIEEPLENLTDTRS